MKEQKVFVFCHQIKQFSVSSNKFIEFSVEFNHFERDIRGKDVFRVAIMRFKGLHSGLTTADSAVRYGFAIGRHT